MQPTPRYGNVTKLRIQPGPRDLDLRPKPLQAEVEAGSVDISGANSFQQARKLIRAHLQDEGILDDFVEAVTELLLSSASSETE